MKIVENAPRRVRVLVRRMVMAKFATLLAVGPKFHGKQGYRYGAKFKGELILFGKPVDTREEARNAEAIRRFGMKASEYRIRTRARKAA